MAQRRQNRTDKPWSTLMWQVCHAAEVNGDQEEQQRNGSACLGARPCCGRYGLYHTGQTHNVMRRAILRTVVVVASKTRRS